MRRAALDVLALSLALSGGACGGGSSPSAASKAPPVTAPSATAPTLTDGWSDQPVAAEVTPATVRTGQSLVARAPGYLTREQTYQGQPIQLWPADEAYVRALVYDWEFTDGSFRMVRWAGPFTVSLDGSLAEDQDVLNKALEVVQELSTRTGMPISVGAGGTCVIKIDPAVADEGAVAIAYNSFHGATIVGAEVLFLNRGEILGRRRRSDWDNTLLHEMGHVLGLAHSPDVFDVMTPGEGPGTTVSRFNDNEAIALHMMYAHRSAGNRPPDLDPQLAGASLATPRFTAIRD